MYISCIHEWISFTLCSLKKKIIFEENVYVGYALDEKSLRLKAPKELSDLVYFTPFKTMSVTHLNQ